MSCVLWTLRVVCFQVQCGRRLCLLRKALPAPDNNKNTPPSCPGGHECVEHQFLTCFSPPCHQWGVCSTPDPPTPLHTQCEPNSGYLDDSCARITLIFKRDKVPQVSHFLFVWEYCGLILILGVMIQFKVYTPFKFSSQFNRAESSVTFCLRVSFFWLRKILRNVWMFVCVWASFYCSWSYKWG